MDAIKPHGLLSRRASCRGRYHASSVVIFFAVALFGLVARISENGIDPRLSEAPQNLKNWPLWLSYAQRQ
jgi:hypothetical protein